MDTGTAQNNIPHMIFSIDGAKEVLHKLLNVGGPREALLLFQAYLCLVLLMISPLGKISCQDHLTSAQILNHDHSTPKELEYLFWTKGTTEDVCSRQNYENLIPKFILFLLGFAVTVCVRNRSKTKDSKHELSSGILELCPRNILLLIYALVTFSRYFVFPQLTAMHYGYTNPLQLLLSPFVLLKSLLLMVVGLPSTLLYRFPQQHVVSMTTDELVRLATPACGQSQRPLTERLSDKSVAVSCSGMCTYVFPWSNVLLVVLHIIPCLVLLIDSNQHDNNRRTTDNSATISVQTDNADVYDKGTQCEKEFQTLSNKHNDIRCVSCSSHKLVPSESVPNPIQLSNTRDIRRKFPTKPVNITKPLHVCSPSIMKAPKQSNIHPSHSFQSQTKSTQTESQTDSTYLSQGQNTATQTDDKKVGQSFKSSQTDSTDMVDKACQSEAKEEKVEQVTQSIQTVSACTANKECQSKMDVSSKIIQVGTPFSYSDTSTVTEMLQTNDFGSQTTANDVTNRSPVSHSLSLEAKDCDIGVGDRVSELKSQLLNSIGLERKQSDELSDQNRSSFGQKCEDLESHNSIGVNTVIISLLDKSTVTEHQLSIDEAVQHPPESMYQPNASTQTSAIMSEEKSIQCSEIISKRLQYHSSDIFDQSTQTFENKEDTHIFDQDTQTAPNSFMHQNVQCSLCCQTNSQGSKNNSNNKMNDNSNMRNRNNKNHVSTTLISKNSDQGLATIAEALGGDQDFEPCNKILKFDTTASARVTTNEVYVQTLHLTKGESGHNIGMGFHSLSTDVFEDERLQELHLYNDYKSIEALSHTYRMSSSKSTQVDFQSIREELDNLHICQCQKGNVEEALHSLFMLKDEKFEEKRCKALKLRAKKWCEGVWYVCLRADVFLTVCQQVVSNIQMLSEVEVVQQFVEDELLRTMKGFLDNYSTLSLYFEDDDVESDDDSFLSGFRL